MILLDTNVVSEAMKPDPHPLVRDWLDAQAAETLFLSPNCCSASARCRAASARTGWQLRSTACWICSRPAFCPSIPPRRGAMPLSPSRRAAPEKLSHVRWLCSRDRRHARVRRGIARHECVQPPVSR
jgi:hypothetical protein